MGLVSKEIVRFWIPPCTMPCLVLMRRGNRPLNQLTALLGFDEVIVTPLSTSSGLVQRSCSSILLLFKSNIWGGQECCSSILYYISNSNIWGAKCSSYIIYSIQHVSDWITCNSHSIGCFYFLLPCCGSNIILFNILLLGIICDRTLVPLTAPTV